MARIARVVVPGVPHLIVQKGENNRQVFFSADDFSEYLKLIAEGCKRCSNTVWAYCLMPNHVHLLVTPTQEQGLARALGEAHRRYATYINARYGRTGKLWHLRFSSCAVDFRHSIGANVSFADGHVEWRERPNPGSYFDIEYCGTGVYALGCLY